MTDADLGKSVLNVSPNNPRNPAVAQLIARLEAVTEGNRELDADIAGLVLGGEIVWKMANLTMDQHPVRRYVSAMHVGGFGAEPVRHHTTSLDAALTLVPEGWDWNIGSSSSFDRAGFFGYVRGYAEDPPDPEGSFHGPSAPLALCIAALKARQTEPQTGPMELRELPNTDAAQEPTPGST